MSHIVLLEGARWAFRLLLDLEPPPEDVELLAAACPDALALRSTTIDSLPFANRFKRAGEPRTIYPLDADLTAGVIWAYRLLFSQEPSDYQISYQRNRVSTVDDIKAVFLLSREFEVTNGYGLRDLSDLFVLRHFAPFCSEPAPPGFFHDFLGSRTRCSFLPSFLAWKSGSLEGGPNTSLEGMYSAAEWVATLRSVLEARSTVVAVELGAGWAPWLVTVATAAARRGLSDVHLIGVEGSAEHVEFCRQHLVDNGINPGDHRVVHAVAGARDGVARFPRLVAPSDDYGASASFDGAGSERLGDGGWQDVECVSIETLLRDVDRVDILHTDIQGAETAVLNAGMQVLNSKVRRIVVGTHSRRIEAELFDLFQLGGWILEHEKPCAIRQRDDGTFALMLDGEQVWRNTRC